MKNIREAVHDCIEHRILPWIERDGISKLLLPEQITPDDCARIPRCDRLCTGHRAHAEFGIGLAGKAPYCIDRKAFLFTPSRILLLPADTPHGSAKTGWRRVANINLDKPSSILWLAFYLFGIRVQVTYFPDDEDVEESIAPYMLLDHHAGGLMSRLLEEVQARPSGFERIGRCILMEILERCLRATSAASSTRKSSTPPPPRKGRSGKSPKRGKSDKSASRQPAGRVQAARDFIHSNYNAPISLDDIAEAAESSATHLIRQFKAATGKTPVQYLMEVRMDAARELLMTDLKILEVSHMVGIEDHAYFSRLFRNINGVSPLAHRRQLDKQVIRTPHPRKSKK